MEYLRILSFTKLFAVGFHWSERIGNNSFLLFLPLKTPPWTVNNVLNEQKYARCNIYMNLLFRVWASNDVNHSCKHTYAHAQHTFHAKHTVTHNKQTHIHTRAQDNSVSISPVLRERTFTYTIAYFFTYNNNNKLLQYVIYFQ